MNTSSILISLLVFFGGFLAVGIALTILFFYLKKKVQRYSRKLLGTANVAKHFSDIQKDYEATPKSIADTSNLYLPKIMKDFPDFHYDEMLERAKNVLISYLMSMQAMTSKLPDYVTSELKDELNLHLSQLKLNNQKEVYKNIVLHSCAMHRYSKQNGRCTISLQASIQFIYTLKDSSGRLLKGNESTIIQSKYNIDLVYIQDRTLVENLSDAALASNCPNCGAPLTSLGAKICAYCESPIQELNILTWSFNNVKPLLK